MADRIKRTTIYRAVCVALAVSWILPQYLLLMARERLPVWRPSDDAWLRVHRRTARVLHGLAVHLAGMFVKACQIIGARADVFPRPFIETLSRFHDRVPPRPFAALRPYVERQLGAELDKIFRRVDHEPLAAASLAQVHEAVLIDDQRVVLKIQYPEIARLARVDLASFRRVVRVVALVQKRLDLRSLVDEIASFIELELDFEREATSTERIAASFEGSEEVRIPRVFRERCTPRILVLEYLEGIQVTHVAELEAAGHDRAAIAARIGRIYTTMIFEHGFFHGDPHPGNLLVLEDGAIGLLDFGLAKELPVGFAPRAARMFASVFSGDSAGTLAAARELGFEVAGSDPEDLRKLMRMLVGERIEGANVLDLLADSPLVKLPPDFGLVARTLIILNGLSYSLAPRQRLIQLEMARVLVPLAMKAGSSPVESGRDREEAKCA